MFLLQLGEAFQEIDQESAAQRKKVDLRLMSLISKWEIVMDEDYFHQESQELRYSKSPRSLFKI